MLFVLHSHENGSFVDEDFNSREICKHHVHDEEEEGTGPVISGESQS